MEYNIVVEFDDKLDETTAERVLTALAPFGPAATRSVLGRLEAVFTFHANDVAQAFALGYHQALTVDRRIVALQVLPTADFDRSVDFTPVPDLVNAVGASKILGITPAAVGQKFSSGELPGQRIGERIIVFATHDIEAIAKRRTSDGNLAQTLRRLE